MLLVETGFDNFGPQLSNTRNSAFFVLLHEGREANDIGCQNNS